MVNEERLRSTTSADVWAEEFAKVCPEVDQDLMLGWFANAIEHGREAGMKAGVSQPLSLNTAAGQGEGTDEREGRLYYAVETNGDLALFEDLNDARHAAGQIRMNPVNTFADECRTYLMEDDDWIECRKAVKPVRIVAAE